MVLILSGWDTRGLCGPMILGEAAVDMGSWQTQPFGLLFNTVRWPCPF